MGDMMEDLNWVYTENVKDHFMNPRNVLEDLDSYDYDGFGKTGNVKCGDETRSLPPDISPLDITFDQAMQLLAQPKRGGRAAAKKEPIKVFEKSPVTDLPVQLLDGRYGPYVTDGTTNASIPKGTNPDQISFEQALDLLAIRAAKGPATRKRAKKKTNKKKSAKKKTTKKKTTKKQAK